MATHAHTCSGDAAPLPALHDLTAWPPMPRTAEAISELLPKRAPSLTSSKLQSKVKYYESQKSEVIRECNVIGLTLSKKYDNNPNLTGEENELLKSRQGFFKKHFELGMNSVSSKLLAIKKQAEKIEERIRTVP